MLRSWSIALSDGSGRATVTWRRALGGAVRKMFRWTMVNHQKCAGTRMDRYIMEFMVYHQWLGNSKLNFGTWKCCFPILKRIMIIVPVGIANILVISLIFGHIHVEGLVRSGATLPRFQDGKFKSKHIQLTHIVCNCILWFGECVDSRCTSHTSTFWALLSAR